jgi:DNA-binding NarL/FixJ family response regulator
MGSPRGWGGGLAAVRERVRRPIVCGSGAGVTTDLVPTATPTQRRLVGPSVARRIVGFFLESSQRYAQGAFPELTPRERDVLDLLAAGKRNTVIARELTLSEKTVRNHLSSILGRS